METRREALGILEHVVRDRNGGFHTAGITARRSRFNTRGTAAINGSRPVGQPSLRTLPAIPLHRLVPRGALYRPITRSIPENTASICRFGILPTRSVNCRLSTVTSCDTFATESRSNPVCFALRSTLPGATDQRRLLVRATHTTVAIWLWFSGSDCTTTTGRR